MQSRLKSAIDHAARTLSPERQDELAEVIEAFSTSDDPISEASSEAIAALRCRLSAADQSMDDGAYLTTDQIRARYQNKHLPR